MTLIAFSNGHRIVPGRKLGEGGEGGVYEISQSTDRLVKLYHKPIDDLRRNKLLTMVQMGVQTSELAKSAAWPLDAVYNDNRQCVGFVMPLVSGPGVIDKLSHPAEQRVTFPTVNYGFLLHVALNLMHAASTLHHSGCVIGDVNESNVYVLSNGTVRFIDVDSFQIHFNGHFFPCNVGTPLYTPPELQSTTLSTVVRTMHHDAFGLAVLVFQLLVQGRHPFAGVPKDGRGRPIEESIREGLYAYSLHRADRVSPPPGAMSISSLGALAGLFERAFLSSQRPPVAEWIAALASICNNLTRCSRNARHVYLKGSSSCPLCALSRDPLPPSVMTYAPDARLGGVSIGDLLRQARQVPEFGDLNSRCREPAVMAYEQVILDSPPSITNRQKQKSSISHVAAQLLGIGGALCFIFPPIGILLLLVGLILWVVGQSQLRTARNKAMRVFTPARDSARSALQRLQTAESEAQEEQQIAMKEIQPSAKILAEARDWLANADTRLKAALDDADRTYRRQRLNEHLEQCLIAHASIPDIGPSRKATLASFGVETAADVDVAAITRIPGFGPRLTDRMLDWRRACESMFRHHHTHAPADWLQRIRQQHDATVAATAGSLRKALSDYRTAFPSNDRRLAHAAKAVDIARREYRESLSRVRAT